MIGVAYGIPQDVIDGDPDWVKTGGNRFDLEGKADDPSTATETDLLMMLQNLLADRFKLKFHWEAREIDGFELFVAKDGPTFHEAKPDEEEKISVNAGFVLGLLSGNRPDGDNAGVPSMPATLNAQKVSMARFAELIEPAVRGHVEYRTNLKGFYNLNLAMEPGEAISAPLEKKLGLKVERRKISVRFFIVDDAEKPSAN